MSVDPFKCELVVTPALVTWIFSGVMNEHMVIPKYAGEKPLLINLNKVKMVNSYGIKIWSKWVIDHKNSQNITLEECPFVFVNNFSMIKGFISNNMTVKSFYVPFFSESSQERRDVLFQIGTDYQINGFLRLPDVKDSKDEYMELDVNPTRYFSFLKKS